MKFKRLMALMLALVVFAAFAIGCSKPADDAGKANEEEKVAEETKDDETKEESQEDEEAEEDDGPVQEGGTLTIGLFGEPEQYCPLVNYLSVIENNIAPNVFSGLVKLNLKKEIIPDLAESYEYKDDGKTIVFHLRDNVKWHDGVDFSAEDVKWSYDAYSNNKNYSDYLFNLDSVNVIDKNTVAFKLKQADAAFIANTADLMMYVLPKHIYGGNNIVNNPANKAPIGTGPFKFVEQKAGESVTLEKNPVYFGKGPYLDKLVFKIYDGLDPQFKALINDEIDYGAVPYNEVDNLANNDKYKFVSYLVPKIEGIEFNVKSGKFADSKLREAVLYGLDRKAICDKVHKDRGSASDYFISPIYEWALNDDAKMPERDVEKAKKLIEEAGFTMNSDGYYFETSYLTNTKAEYDDLYKVLAEQFKEIGIKLNRDELDYSDYVAKIHDKKDFEITVINLYNGADISSISEVFQSYSSINFGNYSNEEMDKELILGRSAYKIEDRAPHYKKVQEIARKDLPVIFLWNFGYKTPVKKYIKNMPFDKVKDEVTWGEYTLTWIDESKK